MQAKRRLSALALGTLLCSVAPAGTHAATDAAAGEVARGNVASLTGIEVQLLRVLPLGRAGPELADLVEQDDRAEVVVTLTGAPPDLVSPSLVAEIHEGTCLGLRSAPVRAADETPAGYSLTPSVFSLRSFSAILPVSFAALRSGAHAITVRTGVGSGNAGFACVDVA